MSDKKKRLEFLRRSAKEVRNYHVHMRLALIVLGMLVLLLTAIYTISAVYKDSGSLTVSINKVDMTKYGLTLSEREDLSHRTSYLTADITESMTNIAAEQIPENVDAIDGEHNGQNYIAYTFYLMNAGDVEFSYEYAINLSNVTNSLDEAIRLRLYVDGVPTTYAKTSSDGTGPERNTTEFASATVMARGRTDAFAPGDVTKFTIVVWIEGNDPDCIDLLIGGTLKMDMTISVAH
ncbi:MAG: hypothetical protein IJW83_03845 [Clostridia bacterium]|nr:hypothetical protein [Clostridia bacterium]